MAGLFIHNDHVHISGLKHDRPDAGRGAYASGESALTRLIRTLRPLWIALGLLLIVVGLPAAFLPTHIGIVLVMLGLIVVLRNSLRWRRRFIVYQRRYPRWIYPVRRLLRRQIWPVLWHETLRMERFWLPTDWRQLRRARRRVIRRGRHS